MVDLKTRERFEEGVKHVMQAIADTLPPSVDFALVLFSKNESGGAVMTTLEDAEEAVSRLEDAARETRANLQSARRIGGKMQ